MDLFDSALLVATEDVKIVLNDRWSIPWADHTLSPRQLRGSDFLMRLSQGRWSEMRLVEAINATGEFHAVPYGPSSVAPSDIYEFNNYFDRLEAAGLGQVKRPDLLIFEASERRRIENLISEVGGCDELPFTSEEDDHMRQILASAIMGIECENSLWIAAQMRNYGEDLRPMKRLGNKPGLPKNATVPTVIVKEEDRGPLSEWQNQREVPLHIWHVFYDMGFGISLDDVECLIGDGMIDKTEQTFQAPGGATTTKLIYKIYYHYAYPLGATEEAPELVADQITSDNGHILPYVRFEGGSFQMAPEAIDVLRQDCAR